MTELSDDLGGTPFSRLRIPRPAAVRTVWPSEPADFTPWLAGNLHLLEMTGLGPLELVQTEVAIPGTGRALDILARTGTGDLVAVENQFATADHDHLTRGLAYAVGLEAVALILIAESHLGEFRAVAAYLNAVAERSDHERRIAVYLLSLSVEEVEGFFVPRLDAIESPNAWMQSAAAVTPLGPTYLRLEDFYAAVPHGARDAVRDVGDWWSEQPGASVRHSARNAVSLDRPHPTKRQPLSHMLLNINGTYTVQRGYLLESGVVPDTAVDQLDAFLRLTFPDLQWSGKHYFLNSRDSPRLEAVQSFMSWLNEAS